MVFCTSYKLLFEASKLRTTTNNLILLKEIINIPKFSHRESKKVITWPMQLQADISASLNTLSRYLSVQKSFIVLF